MVSTDVNRTFLGNRIALNLLAGYHTQHSVVGGDPIYCGSFSFPGVVCRSNVSQVRFSIESSSRIADAFRIGLNNSRIDMSFGYAVDGSADGVDLWEYPPNNPNHTSIDANRYFTKIGHSNFIGSMHEVGLPNLLPRAGPASSQEMMLNVRVEFPGFFTLDYDPDIRLALLFDSSEVQNPQSSAANPTGTEAALNDMGVSPGLIGGIIAAVIGVALIIISTGIILKRRQKRRLRRQEVEQHFIPR